MKVTLEFTKEENEYLKVALLNEQERNRKEIESISRQIPLDDFDIMSINYIEKKHKFYNELWLKLLHNS